MAENKKIRIYDNAGNSLLIDEATAQKYGIGVEAPSSYADVMSVRHPEISTKIDEATKLAHQFKQGISNPAADLKMLTGSSPGNVGADIGQMAGGAIADFLPGGPLVDFGLQYAGSNVGNAVINQLMKNEGGPSQSEQAVSAATGAGLGLLLKGGSKIYQEIKALRDASQGKSLTPSSIINWISKRYVPEMRIFGSGGKKVPILPDRYATLPTDDVNPGDTPLVTGRQTAKYLKENKYPALTSQLTASEVAAKQEAANPDLGRIFKQQDQVMQEIAKKDIIDKNLFESTEDAARRWEKLTRNNYEAALGAAERSKEAIYKRIGKESKPLGVFKPSVDEAGRPVAVRKIIDKPINIENTAEYAQKFASEVQRLGDSTINGKLLKDTYGADWNNVRDFVQSGIYSAGSGFIENAYSGKNSLPITDFRDLIRVKHSLDSLKNKLGENMSPALRDLSDAIDKDIALKMSEVGGPDLNKAYNNVNRELQRLNAFKKSKVGKTFGTKTDDLNQKAVEEGYDAVLQDSKQFSRFTSMNGREAAGSFLKEGLLSAIFDKRTGEASLEGGLQFLKKHSDKFVKTLKSEERHAINTFMAALEAQNLRQLSQSYSPAMQRGMEKGMIMSIGSISPNLIKGTAPVFSAVTGRVLSSLGYLTFEKEALSKLVSKPQFAYAAARLMELPKGSPAAFSPMRTILKLAAINKLNMKMTDDNGEESYVTPRVNEDGKVSLERSNGTLERLN